MSLKGEEKIYRNIDDRMHYRDHSGSLGSWLKRLRLIAGLQSGSDIEATVVRIRNGVQLRGANLWILLCAAIIASIGLNTSSAAVIIGAMLISPLMGPILGIGLGIAIHDRAMLLRALRTFGAAVGVSLLTSILYFWATPITFATSELLARTSPTLLDVGIAFFGGIAGIIAGSRREVTTAIPGVAIATALMPPLCTAGYGLANGNWTFFWGALYLFFLNAVFISLATFLIVRLLGVPYVAYVDRAVERQVVRWIAIIVTVALIPSIVIFSKVIRDLRRHNAAQSFVRERLEIGGRKALNWSLESTDVGEILSVYLVGPPMDTNKIDSLSARLPEFGLSNERLKVIQMNLPVQTETHVDQQELLAMLQNADLQQELARNLIVASSQTARPPKPVDTIPIARIRREMLAAFSTLVDVSYAEQRHQRQDTIDTIHVFMIRQATTGSRKARRAEFTRMQSFLQERLGADSLRLIEVVDSLDSARPAITH